MHRQGPDPYHVLGLDVDASQHEIRQAFRRLAFRCHPDRNPGDPCAEERFKLITDAFQRLANPALRAAHDRQHPGPNGSARKTDPFDMLARQFAQVFGAAGASEPCEHGGPEQSGEIIFLQVGFLEAALGTVREVQVERASPCQDCKELGAVPEGTAEDCLRCGGSGKVTAGIAAASMDLRCPDCRGLGLWPWRLCEACSGAGQFVQWEDAQARIPPGAATGQLVRIRTPSGREASALLEVEPHEFFRRRGRDLLVRVKISMETALNGGVLTVPGLEGELRANVPPGLRTGKCVRIKGHGLPADNGARRGDLVAEIEVAAPKHQGLRNLLSGLGPLGSGGLDPGDS